MCALFEIFVGHQSQIPDLMSLAFVALVVWGMSALIRNGNWIVALLLFLIIFPLDVFVLIGVYKSFGKPPADALFFYRVRLSTYLAPWIAAVTCFAVATVIKLLARRTYSWLPSLIFGIFSIMWWVLVIAIGWIKVWELPKLGWGLQYIMLLPVLLVISMVDKFPLKNMTPHYDPHPGIGFKRWMIMAAVLVFLMACQIFTGLLVQHIIIMVGIYAIAVYGLNMLTGLCGQVSAFQWTMYGIGAYAAAILHVQFGYNLFLTVPLAGLSAASVALLIGLFSFLKPYHFGILTVICSGLIVPVALSLETWTKGPHGILLPKGHQQSVYYLTLALAAGSILLYEALYKSRIGRTMVSIREGQSTSFSLVYPLRIFAFTLSGLMAGVAGGLFAHHLRFVNSSMFEIHHGLMLLWMLIIGAMGTRFGPLAAIAVILFVQDYVLRGHTAFPGERFVVLSALAVVAMFAYGYYFRIRPQRESHTGSSSDTEIPLSGPLEKAAV